MTRVTALTQFVFVALGTMALMILMKTPQGHYGFSQALRLFLTQNGLWMFLIPIAYATACELVLYASPRPVVEKSLQGAGVFIGAVLLATYGWLILTF